ncbi:S-layer homology domain-containing protein [Cohnella zeiphila]|uniref:S-layer homology domain-containing protein n=1 Tax=Cohnella zeiphila TaxID=2761120 RepID=A0A7X0SMV6_9BACL|nr:S-layer homology domain-containing protein [Cohnella zeiphila]MBB6732928.1 S-layer homology domain-containing protein [Cohnella zeiphila]
MALVSRGKIWTSLLLVLMLIGTGAAYAAPSASAASATPFGDVPAGHWAEKHIAKLALQGLVNGKAEGQFKPNDALSREEAVVLAIRFMGQADKVDTKEVVAFPSTFSVDNYFKAYVNYAFKQGLLNMTEEFKLASSEPSKPWGSASASREWVARLLVRAIGKEADATAAATKATSFSDNASIDPALLGYVNVAVSTGLVKGVDESKFDPKGTLTRAAAATLFSRAEPLVQTAYPGQASGIWLNISPTELTMLHSDGTTSTYSVTDSTLFSRADSEKLLTEDALTLYGKATVISPEGGQADYAEQLDDTPQVKTVEGKLVVVNESKHKLSVLVGQDVEEYEYDPDQEPVATDADNNAIELGALPADANVTLMVDAFSQSPKLVAVSVKSSTVAKSGSGTIVSVDTSARSILVKDASTAVASPLAVASTATIQKNGTYVNLPELAAGDAITYSLLNDEVTSIVVTPSSANTVQGYLFKVDTTAKTVQYTAAAGSSDIKAKFYADNVTVSIPNATSPDLSNLYAGDAITMTLDANGKIVGIEVKSRAFTSVTGGTITSYDADSKILVVKDPSGTPGAYTLDDATKFDLNGTAISQSTASYYLTKGKKVNLGYLGTKLVFLSVVSRYEGTVVKNDTNAHTLQLTLKDGSSVSVGYGTPAVDIYGVTTANYSNVAAGDKVTVLLDSNQNMATSILVNKTVQYDIYSANAAQNKLNVTDSAGTTTEWTVGAGVSILGENGQAADLSVFTAGSALNAVYEGKTLRSIQLVPVVFGQVASVDAAAGTVTVQPGANAAVTRTVGTSPIITKSGSTVSSLSSLSAGDRVEIRNNAANQTVITVVAGTAKEVWVSDAVSSFLKFKTSSLTEDSVKVAPTAYIHQGATTLTLSNLSNGDKVTVYVLRNKAVEIVKS